MQAYEIEKKDGTKVGTRHGGIIKCSYCNEQEHNRKGCGKIKASILPRPKLQVRRGPKAIPDSVSHDDGQVTLDDGQFTQEQAHVTQDDDQVPQEQVQDFGCTMLHRMPLSRLIPRENAEGTVPDTAFISRASSSQALIQTTIATKYGNLTMKLMQMKRDKERKIVARRDATLEAMNGMAERRAEEAEATRQEISMMKAEQTERTIRVPREKKAEETTAKQEATTTRKVALQQEKEASAIEAILARAEAALKKKEDQEAKIVVPALKRKEHQEANKKQQE
ncbi:hypothetical protein D1007_54186 [Hordeum vulgare]|nr:hypothetical protein D1007_54186 [Hordeum vulgare]